MRHGHPGVFGFLDGCRLPPDAVRKLEELDNPNKHSKGRATEPEEVRQDEVVDSSSQVAKSQSKLLRRIDSVIDEFEDFSEDILGYPVELHEFVVWHVLAVHFPQLGGLRNRFCRRNTDFGQEFSSTG